MSAREERFIDFFVTLWKNHPECFKINYDIWTERVTDDEDWIFSVVLRTLIWNDNEAERLFHKIGGFNKAQSRFSDNQVNFKEWLSKEISGVKFGDGKPGAHRDNRHKKSFPRTLVEYLNKVGESQKEFIIKNNNFDKLFHAIKVYNIGSLTSWDILERLHWSRRTYHLEEYPRKFYLTGCGVKKGLKKIYLSGSSNHLEMCKLGEMLTAKIQSRIKIKEDLLRFKLEDILCIYQKRRDGLSSDYLLEGKLTPRSFAEKYAQEYCKEKSSCRFYNS